MAKNIVRVGHLEEGATWTHVHSSGTETEYIYTALIVPLNAAANEGLGHDAMHRLTNPLTGKDAMVSEKWLREGSLPLRTSQTGHNSHWLPVAEAPNRFADADMETTNA